MPFLPYDPQAIEKKWQTAWLDAKVFAARDDSRAKKRYVLDMFPYPSAQGLHVGHPEGYTASDILSRYLRMQGKEVLHPMGFDSFGLPAENYAIKTGTHPAKTTAENITNMRRQIQSLGFSYDWDREVITSDPSYYKWTQWIFLKLFKKGLAYEAEAPINWCPKDKTGLANEEVVGGKCDRCGTPVEKKNIRQWLVKITDERYIERLLNDLDNLDWPESIKQLQRNWIGKSEGAEVQFSILPQWPKRVIILHGYQGQPNTGFKGWLRDTLEKQGVHVDAPQLSQDEFPNLAENLETVLALKPDEGTIILGHSLGCITALELLQQKGVKVAGLVLVAPPYTPARDDVVLPSGVAQYSKYTFDAKKIHSLTPQVTILADTHDDLVRREEPTQLANILGVQVQWEKAPMPHYSSRNGKPFSTPSILNAVAPGGQRKVNIFTTRPDTLFGATYLVLAPEHALVKEITTTEHRKEVEAYVAKAAQKTDLDRTDLAKEKTGVFTGAYAINPVNQEKIPVWVADYVLASYGTGAIMAVPAHDERDFGFAKKYDLPIRHVIAPHVVDEKNPPQPGKPVVARKTIQAIVFDHTAKKCLTLKWKHQPWQTFVVGGVDAGEDIVAAAKREIQEETGFVDVRLERVMGGPVLAEYYAAHKGENRKAMAYLILFSLQSAKRITVTEAEQDKHEVEWWTLEEISRKDMACAELPFWLERLKGKEVYTGEGVMVRETLPSTPVRQNPLEAVVSPGANGHLSNDLQRVGYDGPYEGLTSQEFRKVIVAWLEKTGVGKAKVQYKLRDWVFSRQRYWGEPIPMVHCAKCGIVAVPEKDLPVELPNVEKYEPTGTGESPLAGITDWVKTKCPNCGGPAKRETNTMPQWAGSNWYFLRYCDPHNTKKFADPKKLKAWLPVDVYVGGAEHAVLHLLYARFIYKVLYDIGEIPKELGDEPFLKLKNQGLILGEDGVKMSKSRGNVINPDDVIREYGADAVRMYEMFMGPFEDAKPWSTQGIRGVTRFLEKVWEIGAKLGRVNIPTDPKAHRMLNQLIKKVSDHIESFRFNTAVSALMIYVNYLKDRRDDVTRGEFSILLQLLSPFAPHIAEELWHAMKEHGDQFILQTKWPEPVQEYLADLSITIVIQINGKVRDKIEMPNESTEDEIKEAVFDRPLVQKWLAGKEPKQFRYVPGKIVSIVV